MTWSLDLVTWPSHLIQYTTSSIKPWFQLKPPPPLDLRPILNIRPTIHACDWDLHPLSICQRFTSNPTKFWSKRFKLLHIPQLNSGTSSEVVTLLYQYKFRGDNLALLYQHTFRDNNLVLLIKYYIQVVVVFEGGTSHYYKTTSRATRWMKRRSKSLAFRCQHQLFEAGLIRSYIVSQGLRIQECRL